MVLVVESSLYVDVEVLSFRPSQASQAKVLTGGGDLREALVDVPSVSHSCD